MSGVEPNANCFLPAAPRENLVRRAELLRQAREFFHERGFLEVETPLLSADVVVDRHLEPISVTLDDDPRAPDDPRRGQPLWLQTSPEFGMKRLLAAGLPAIYQVTRAFRGGERGALHNTEFTMIEWYRAGDDYAAGMQLLDDFAQAMLGRGPAERVAYREAFARTLQIDPFAADAVLLEQTARRRKLNVPDSFARDDCDVWLDLLLVECIEPHLGRERPAILYDYPAAQAALARKRATPEGEVAERFELYVNGMELANGYHELLAAEELRARQTQANADRERAGRRPLPEENRLLAAMDRGLPPCSGTALGFDRLVMAALGASSLQEVMAFPIDRA